MNPAQTEGDLPGFSALPKKHDPLKCLSLEDLQRRVAVLEQEKAKEARARNHLLLERDRVLEFWEVTKARLAATEAALRLKTLELEEQQAAHSVAIKVYRDRLRSLMAAHSTREEEIKVAGEAALQQRTSELAAQAGAREDGHRSSLHQARLEVQNAREAQNRCMLECEARVDAHRATFERIAASVHERYEGHLAEQVHAAEERCQAQVHAVAKQRDDAVAKLEAQQEAAMKEAREHFAATCSAQLDLVAALKGDVQQAREAAEKAHRRIATNRAPINAN